MRLGDFSSGLHGHLGSTGDLLPGYLVGLTGELLCNTQQDTRRDPLAGCSGAVGYSAGFTDELLWRDIRRDPLASHSGGILAGGMLGGGVV